MFSFTMGGSTRPAEPFSEEEIKKVDKALDEIKNRLGDRSEALEVVSTFHMTRSGPEYEVVIYDDGIPDSAARIYRDLATGDVIWTMVLGTVGGK